METVEKYMQNAIHLSIANKTKFVTLEHLLYCISKLSMDFFVLFKELSDNNIQALQQSLQAYISSLNKLERNNNISIPNSNIIDLLESKPTIKNFLIYINEQDDLFAKQCLLQRNFDFSKLYEDVDKAEKDFLEEYTLNLTSLAEENKLDELIGREYELNRMQQILLRKNKCSPILVGEAGVGKTSIVEGLAIDILKNNISDELKDYKVYSLDMMSLMSSMSFEGVLKKILDILSKHKSILFIDEIHTIVGTGSSRNADMSNLLKPVLARGEIKLIGATTFLEYKNTIEKNKALNRRFSKIDVDEPNEEEAFEILKGIQSKYEKYHNIELNDEILFKAVEYGKKYFIDKNLPDSAIDLIDELGSSFKMKKETKPSVDDLNEILSKMTKTKKNYDFNKQESLQNLEKELKSNIFGQDKAISQVYDILQRNYAGLGNENSPLGVFLFTGSSGVGKTEFCKVLSKGLGIHLERFDMSEYSHSHEQAKFIGSPAGYVGYEDGGILTNAIRANPHCVLLFDEIEKAHPMIMNTFLQIFDNGILTDSSGIKVNFKNTIIVMTSNLGTKEENKMGFVEGDEDEKANIAIKNFFAPEFINRIDKIIHFNDLSKDYLFNIVDKEIDIINKKLKNVIIEITDEVKEYLVDKGYKKEFGARFLKRTIANELNSKLSKEILFGNLKDGGIVKIDIKDDNIVLTNRKGSKINSNNRKEENNG